MNTKPLSPLFVLLLLLVASSPRSAAQGAGPGNTHTAPVSATPSAGAGGTTTVTEKPCPDNESERRTVAPKPLIGFRHPGARYVAPLDHLFFLTRDETVNLYFKNEAEVDSQDPCLNVTGMCVRVDVSGFAGLLELSTIDILLMPQAEWPLVIQQGDFDELFRWQERDILGVARVRVRAWPENDETQVVFDQDFIVHRFYDLVDAEHADGMIEFSDTASPDPSMTAVTRSIELLVDAGHEDDLLPELQITGDPSGNFQITQLGSSREFLALQFAPRVVENDLKARLGIRQRGSEVGSLNLQGDGVLQYLWVHETLLREELERLPMLPEFAAEGFERCRAVIDSPAKRAAVISRTMAKVRTMFTPYGAGIVFGHGPGIPPPKHRSIFFDVFNFDDRRTLNPQAQPFAFSMGYHRNPPGHFPLVDRDGEMPPQGPLSAPHTGARMRELVAMMPELNRAEMSFRLTELLNEIPGGASDVYPLIFLRKVDVTTEEHLVNLLAKTIVHEAGHHLGLEHTAATIAEPVDVLHGTSNYLQLGAVPKNGNSPGLFKGFTIYVDERTFTIDRYDVAANRLYLTAPIVGYIPRPETSVSAVGKVRLSGYPNAWDDIMAQGPDIAGTMRPVITDAGYRIALGLEWTLQEAEDTLEYYRGVADRLAPNSWDDDGPADPDNEPAVGWSGPTLWISDDTGRTCRSLEFTSGGGQPVTGKRTITLRNLGTEVVNITALAYTGSPSFRFRDLPRTLTLRPQAGRTVEVTFAPDAPGEHAGQLRVTSDSITGVWTLRFRGTSVAQGGHLRLDVANNNLGGQRLDGGAVTREVVAVIHNLGADTLTIRRVAIESTDAAFRLAGTSSDLGPAGHPLAPGETFALDVVFEPRTAGLQGATIIVHSDAAGTPELKQTIVATGIDPAIRPRHGGNYVALRLDPAPDTILRAITTDTGDFRFTLPPETAYRHWRFDPESDLLASTHGTSAAAGAPTRLARPVFRASVDRDTDGDLLPDDVELVIGSDPQKADTDGDGVSDLAALRTDKDPLGKNARTRIASLPAPRATRANDTTDPTETGAAARLVARLLQVLKFETDLRAEAKSRVQRDGQWLYTYNVQDPAPAGAAILQSARTFFQLENAAILDEAQTAQSTTITGAGLNLRGRKVELSLTYTPKNLLLAIR